jgi:hypothetical protein
VSVPTKSAYYTTSLCKWDRDLQSVCKFKIRRCFLSIEIRFLFVPSRTAQKTVPAVTSSVCKTKCIHSQHIGVSTCEWAAHWSATTKQTKNADKGTRLFAPSITMGTRFGCIAQTHIVIVLALSLLYAVATSRNGERIFAFRVWGHVEPSENSSDARVTII